jgi:hypothetical protein
MASTMVQAKSPAAALAACASVTTVANDPSRPASTPASAADRGNSLGTIWDSWQCVPDDALVARIALNKPANNRAAKIKM